MLAHSIVTSKSTKPERYILFLHGILGTQANWRSVARRVVDAQPRWGAVLVDLREHGDSLDSTGPHTLAAAAADVAELGDGLGLEVGGAVGHSFGGKVALEWLRGRNGQPTRAWTIDSSPSRSEADRDSTATAAVLRTLRSLPSEWPSREAFVAAVTDAGQSKAIAQWLAMNLRRTEDGGRVFGPDLQAIDDLITDYARTDLWDVVENVPSRCTLDVVIGGRSTVFSADDRQRLARAARREPRLSFHVVEEAGHWVHIDSADTLVSLLSEGFASVVASGN